VIALLHAVVSHVAPGKAQVPQLALQQTMPTLHVLGPHGTLCAWLIWGEGMVAAALAGAALGAGESTAVGSIGRLATLGCAVVLG